MTTNVHKFDPSQGQAFQGDVMFLALPGDFIFEKNDKVDAKDGKLILVEGELTGHHHAIYGIRGVAMFRDDGLGADLARVPTAPPAGLIAEMTSGAITEAEATGTASLYIDSSAANRLVSQGILTTASLAVGFLEVENGPVVVRHEEHDGIELPPGKYFISGQQQWDAAQARRVAD